MEEIIDMKRVKVKETTNPEGLGENNKFFNEEFVLAPLYKKISIDPNASSAETFPYNDFRLELYCPKCKKRRIFNFANSTLIIAFYDLKGNFVSETVSESLGNKTDTYISFKAKGDCRHDIIIIIRILPDFKIEKVGQFPSIYDLNEEINNKDFLKLLDDEYKSYYKTACSLYSFNTCIGALTYLRRIFEKLLADCFKENSEDINISESAFKSMKIEDKVKNLKGYLPSIVFEQGFNKIYSKISDGIHNLSEEECSVIFSILKSAIEEIMIEELARKEKFKRQKELSDKLGSI